MATIKQFKQEIANLVKAQKVAKNINDCSSVYYNRGRLHAMYVAYYILKHKLIGEAMDEYLAKVIKEWKSLETQGWCGSCKPPVKIEQYNEDMLVQVFDSVADAAHWCVDNGYAKTYNGGVRSHISNAAKHKTKTAYGYRWEYAQ